MVPEGAPAVRWKLHVPYSLGLIALALVAGVWYQKSLDARAKLKLAADSTASAMEQLNTTAAAFLARVRADSGREAKTDSILRAKDARIRALGTAAETTANRLAVQLNGPQLTLLDSIIRVDSTRLALVIAQRDAALELFHRAAANRDSLRNLVASYEGQLRAAVAELQRAARTPLFDSKPVRLLQVVLAVKGAADLLQGR